MRLDKFLCDCGLGTRSEIKKILKQVPVMINGQPQKDGKYQVTEDDIVSFEGQILSLSSNTYYLFHKPAGYVCAAYDPKDPVIFEMIPQNRKETLASVGRLDKDTEGLLLVTDDGHLNHQLLAPKKHVEKIYYVEVDGKLTSDMIDKVQEGLDIGDEKPTLPAVLCPLKEDTSFDWELQPWKEHFHGSGQDQAYLMIHEGRYHQIKRMMEAMGLTVTYLKRITMGTLVLDPVLLPGEYRELTEKELEDVRTNQSLYI